MKNLLIIVIFILTFTIGVAAPVTSNNQSIETVEILGDSKSIDKIPDNNMKENQGEKNRTNKNFKGKKRSGIKKVFGHLTNRKQLEGIITRVGVWGPLVYIFMYIFITVTMLPALPITIASGIIFGPVMGVVYAVIGAGLGLSSSFFIARYIAKEAIEKKFGKTAIFIKIDEGVKKDGWFILAVTRLIPIFPFGIQNYVYGLTSIGFVQYSLLSIIFILPGTSVFVILAGAFVSGDKGIVLKYSITASLIFIGLMVVTKITKRKMEFQK